jgi:uncharacterized membrane protein (DUF106 family)
MAEPTKVVKGGFRATLALIFSVIALVLSILAYTSSDREEGLKARIKDLQGAMESIKRESADQLDKLRNETAKRLEKMSRMVKKEKEPKQGSTEGKEPAE